ncbi:putative endonuclease [Solimonas aquatica]|uniref:UPF0102 protein SAMN04488038_103188 n=1 Tax=Solimonas aquatica TaxID=489703 RepID=A0A1H9CUP4_9GAMM|nr:YraN family protein [Solimonas aquatica]SEQ04905.1 putative endonuclease [Solimonas aquatica]
MKGAEAESAALRYLQAQGLKLIARNARYPLGELDLVMSHNQVLVIVEVRSRRSLGFASALESVDSRKQARILRAAQLFIVEHPHYASWPLRFDVFAIDDGKPQWLQNAFDAG